MRSQLCCLLPLPCLSFPALTALPGSRTSLCGRPWGRPGAASAPRGLLESGTCKAEPAQVLAPTRPGVFLLPPDVLGARRRVAQLCREGRSRVGATRDPCPPLSPRCPGTSRRPLVTGMVGYVALPRNPCWPQPSRAPRPRPPSWRFQFCISAAQGGTQPARAKLGGSNGRTGAPPPPAPPLCPPSPGRAGRRCRNSYSGGCATRLVTVTFPGAQRGWRAAAWAGFGQGARAG